MRVAEETVRGNVQGCKQARTEDEDGQQMYHSRTLRVVKEAWSDALKVLRPKESALVQMRPRIQNFM